MNNIQYRGYFRGPKDIGGTTALYDTSEEASTRARACCFDGDEAWVRPEFTGTMDTLLEAREPIDYIDWRATPVRKVIRAGERFKAGELLVADRQKTRADIGGWLVQGKAVVAQVNGAVA